MFAKRIQNLKPSGIRRIFQLAADMEDPINLSIGQAHFDTPEVVKEAAIRAIRDGCNKYTVTQGLPELNERIRASIEKRSGRCPEASLVTSGVSGGLLLSYLALFDPGDSILLPDPHFVIYRVLAELLGVEARFYDLYPDFRISEARLEAAIDERTKAILLNSPSNPTGAVATADELEAVARVARRHDLLVIADEIYDAFVYDAPYRSIVEFYDRVLLLGGFSKTYGVPGWRLGYALGSPDLIDVMETLQQFSFVCAPTPAQHGAIAALDVDMTPWIQSYRGKRRRVVEGLSGSFELVTPGGSFYTFPKAPRGHTGTSFAEEALRHNLLTVPGTAFSRVDTHFRLSFAVEDDRLEKGIEILCRLADKPHTAEAAG